MKKAEPKRIAILGSTGSLGRQALEVVQSLAPQFRVVLLSARNNAELLIQQALLFKPVAVIIGNTQHEAELRQALNNQGSLVFSGEEAYEEALLASGADALLNALVGISGLRPSLAALDLGMDLLLANKESLVVAGKILRTKATQKSLRIVPVDSELTAVLQCLQGEDPNTVERIYLTASGGPFRKHSEERIRNVRKEEALKHPNWSMGPKISIDSATLMNKGFEVIAAHWLFGLSAGQIEVLIHPQSQVHAILGFSDGSMKAQLGLPDMRQAIQYALSWPARLPSLIPRLGFQAELNWEFSPAETESIPCLRLAYEALESGGNAPCILNAANEAAVDAFLSDLIRFADIPLIIQYCMKALRFQEDPDLEDLMLSDKECRRTAAEHIKTFRRQNR